MTEPVIEWRDGLAEFLPAPKKAQSIIRHVLDEHNHDSESGIDYGCSCGEPGGDTNGYARQADHLTEQIMQALTKETP